MPRTILQTIRTRGTPQEAAYAILTLAHRPEAARHGATVRDAAGNLLDTVLLVGDSEGDGGADYGIRLASSEVDPLALASEGDSL